MTNITIDGNPIDAKIHTLIGTFAKASEVNRSAACTAIADAERALKRIVKRDTPLPEEYERVEIEQDRGPVVEFNGRLLAENKFTTHERLEMALEIWETQGGALVAVSASTLPGQPDSEDARVTVVPPQDDVQAMRFAVMQAFNWENRARTMARKLGWSLRTEVE